MLRGFSGVVAELIVAIETVGAFLAPNFAVAQEQQIPACPEGLPPSEQSCVGTIKYPDGATYVGELRNGKPNGKGRINYANGGEYTGGFKNGQMIGRGEQVWPNGDRYFGTSKDGMPNGFGTFSFADGRKYIGMVKLGLPDGRGTFTFPDGTKYVGELKEGKFHGAGVGYRPDGSIRFSGTWIDGHPVEVAHSDQESVAMEQEGGVFVVPIQINGVITLRAIVDSGASEVSVPADVFLTLVRAKTVSPDDYLDRKTYTLADGSEIPTERFRIQTLKIGNTTVRNVEASIASVRAHILLGQSFLGRLKTWSVDNEKHVLNLK